MFFWNSCFFYDPLDVGNSISGSSAFSKTSLNIRKFTVHILLKPVITYSKGAELGSRLHPRPSNSNAHAFLYLTVLFPWEIWI